MLFLGGVVAVCGITGGIRGVADGGSLLGVAAQLACGLLGAAVAAACVVEYGNRG